MEVCRLFAQWKAFTLKVLEHSSSKRRTKKRQRSLDTRRELNQKTSGVACIESLESIPPPGTGSGILMMPTFFRTTVRRSLTETSQPRWKLHTRFAEDLTKHVSFFSVIPCQALPKADSVSSRQEVLHASVSSVSTSSALL